MIEIVLDDDLYRPATFCDHCGREIEQGRQGNFEWQVDDHGAIVDGIIYFTHKQCCWEFEQTRGGRGHWYCDELESLPLFLIANLEIDVKKAAKWAHFKAGI